MADEFYNPYHFVPADGVEKQEAVADLGRGHWPADKRHDRYGKDLLHGRLTCRLRLQTPLVVGAAHTSPENEQKQRKKTDPPADERESASNDYTKVEPYRLNGRIAIPATSLKGMLSSVVEAASRSAMRVLADTKPITWRQPARPPHPLSALGLLRQRHDGYWQILPLTAPTFKIGAKVGIWHTVFGGRLPLRCHFGEYPKRPEDRRRRDFDPASFRASLSADFAPNIEREPDRQPVYYKRDDHCLCSTNSEWEVPHAEWMRTTSRGQSQFCLGQEETLPIINRAAWLAKAEDERQNWVRGYVRVLGGGGSDREVADTVKHNRQLADTKKHEVFIPFSERREREVAQQGDSGCIDVDPLAIERFRVLARERAEASEETLKKTSEERTRFEYALPYTPFGTIDEMRHDREARSEHVLDVRLRDNQIVYFDVRAEIGGRVVVDRLSFSAIWRDGLWHEGRTDVNGAPDQRVKTARPVSMRELFAHHDPDLVPMGPGRQHVTPAEWLFGFVEERTGEDEAADREGRKRRAAVAYRGRVRLSPGRLVQPPDEEETLFVEGDAFRDGEHPRGFVRLKELSSPKPPSPPLYFEKSQGRGFPHHQLKIDHRPKGRKLYLHHREPDYRTKAETADADAAKHRKLAVRPLKAEPVNECGGFAFHIDFENLSRDELDLLCFALRPSDDFRHKLGLGKPLGLGSIEIEIEELALIDRHRRYAEENPFDGGRSRYRWTWTAAGGSSDGCEAPSSRRQCWSAWMEERCPDAYAALIALGESHQLPQSVTPVAYPVAHRQPDEEKLFQWHANNKRWWELGKGDPQWLDELGSGRSIRPLRKNRGR